MTYKILSIVIVLTLGAFGLKAWRPLQSAEDITPQRTHTIDRGHITVWERFEGTIESEDPRPIASTLSQRATLIELAPEGRTVKAGEVIAPSTPRPSPNRCSNSKKTSSLQSQNSIDCNSLSSPWP